MQPIQTHPNVLADLKSKAREATRNAHNLTRQTKSAPGTHDSAAEAHRQAALQHSALDKHYWAASEDTPDAELAVKYINASNEHSAYAEEHADYSKNHASRAKLHQMYVAMGLAPR